MPVPAAAPVTRAAAGRKTLKKRVRGARTCWRDRLRAQIVLAAARGRDNARIAAGLGVTAGTARKWRGRFAERGLEGLEDLPRPGRPRRISEADRAAVVALACQLPAATGMPLSRWTGPEVAAELAAQGLVSGPVSVTSLLRILAENPVKPWQCRSWIYPGIPASRPRRRSSSTCARGSARASRSPPATGSCPSTPSRPSRPAAASTTPCPPLPAGPPAWSTNTSGTARSPYSPGSTCTPTVFASTPGTTGIAPFTDLAGQVMARPEYRDAPRVLVIAGNGSDHRGQAAIDRLRTAHPNAIMTHTPVHASQLGAIHVSVVSPNDFASLEHLSGTLLAFTDRYNRTAKPFTWKCTAADLTDLLRRFSEREQTAATSQTDLAPAA